MITMFGKIVIVNNELIKKNKGTPESQTFKKKNKNKKKIKKKKNVNENDF